MEDVLAVYTRPRDPNRPLVRLDESSKQLLAETRVPIPMKPERPARFDHEYERNGTANLFMMFAPLEGWRHVKVTDRHTAVVAPLPGVKYPRTPGVRPQPEDNPYGAWAAKIRIQGARRDKQTGKRVAIKDNVCVAGVPMMNGASILEGYVPEIEATIVTRILDEGTDIQASSPSSSQLITAIRSLAPSPTTR